MHHLWGRKQDKQAGSQRHRKCTLVGIVTIIPGKYVIYTYFNIVVRFDQSHPQIKPFVLVVGIHYAILKR